jgi:ABC-type multidrug transport system fused ATPase/permease subunit
VLHSLRTAFGFLKPKEKLAWVTFVILRSGLAILDIVGVLAIGLVATSIALFLTEGSSPDRLISFAGLSIPAVTIQSLPLVAGLVLMLFTSKAIFSIVIARRSALLLTAVDARAARAIAVELYGKDLSSVHSRSRDESIFAVQAGASAAFSGVLNSLATILSESTLFILISVGFALVNPLATIGILIYFGLVALAIDFFIGRGVRSHGSVSVRSLVRTSTHISDLIDVYRELATSDNRQEFFNRIELAKLEASRSLALQAHLNSMPRYIIETALLIGLGVLILSQSRTSDLVGAATTLSVFLAGAFRLTAAILPLQTAILNLRGMLPRATTALDLLKEQTDSKLDNPEDSAKAPQINQDYPIGVRIHNLRFAHTNADEPGTQLRIRDVVIEPGSNVAIIGESGSGKSTLSDLVCGLLAPQEGSVELLQQGLAFKPAQLFGQIGYVPQRPNLISGDLKSNVALGIPASQIDRRRVESSLKSALLWDLISSLPQGIDTAIGNLGENLSGGEIQRIGLARALYMNPKLLVMDEATSALDAISEDGVSRVLQALKGKTTVIVIAHRLNTVQHADKVFLMKGGEVVDSGPFKELSLRNKDLEKNVDLLRIQ